MRKIRVALAGNPNSGKSTVFNALTGSKQMVGNWPGVTVEQKIGFLKWNEEEIEITDLPGIYSLSSYSLDEKIARDFLVYEHPDVVVAIVDASNLERNLYLVAQLMEMEKNLIICLNMLDVAKEKGIEINSARLAKILGVPVIETVANQHKGIEELKQLIPQSWQKKVESLKIKYGDKIEECIQKLQKHISCPSNFPTRFFFLKLLEQDKFYWEILSEEDKEKARKVISEFEQNFGEDFETYIIETRYSHIGKWLRKIREKSEKANKNLSERIDSILLNRILGIPLFLAIMWITFQCVFTIGNPISEFLNSLVTGFAQWIHRILSATITPNFLLSFLTEGVIHGVGSVVVFLPNLFILFVAIAILEDSGYMARAAFVMDRFMTFLGLQGKSFIPMILGFGCSIPGIMATRTLESHKDRILTILVLPLMSCSARLPIYTLLSALFFKEHASTIVFSLYIIGICLALIMAKLFNLMLFKSEITPLLMELPPYHLPQWTQIFQYAWYRSSMFLKKAGTVILGGVIVIWLLASLPPGVKYASSDSFLGILGNLFAPIFEPAGFGFWQASVSLISGIMAKEIVVGTLGTLYSASGEALNQALLLHFNSLSAYAFMLMSLIYIPCIATLATIKQEIGGYWALFSACYTCLLGWGVATIFYQLALIYL